VITGNGLIFLYGKTVFAMQRGMIFHTICEICQIFILNAKGKASQFKTVTWSFQIIMICFRMPRCLKNFMKSLLPLNCLPRLGKLICKNGRFLNKILLGRVIRQKHMSRNFGKLFLRILQIYAQIFCHRMGLLLVCLENLNTKSS
jgi:hypothetical protein